MSAGRPATDSEALRLERLVDECVERFGLDLTGLTVLTEAASGSYLHTPVLAASAGAARVHAVTADSAWAPADEVRSLTEAAARRAGVHDRVAVLTEKSEAAVREADIVTNSGFVRPIDREMVSRMKPTSVVPLMWETWEYRSEDLDLEACRERGILVLGTNEHEPPLDMRPYGGAVALKLLFDLGLEGYGTRVILLGGQPTLGGAMQRGLEAMGCEVLWFSSVDGAGEPYELLAERFERKGQRCDALLVAEYDDDRRLLGPSGLLSFDQIARVNPALRIGVVAGNLDAASLQASGLRFHPPRIRPFRYMSYQASDLGPRPVLELYAAGLKVGQEMARARLEGLPPRLAAARALERSPAMDFD
jgi:hypothetical protein